ncbi:MmcQ/YjbR family DNA-binding protein [Acidicapsa ligni]|uniref:MmcQ/YjbR family DNA-binding protein n=1 Tax=Acidicapsa ligni TaxID=542300 RepID=UPI0021DF8D7B|nr:MmcQ/YjbR family DNA-binding protein [Acidicapsa ligni]
MSPEITIAEDEIGRVRRCALALPGTSEKLSHGEPTFFVQKRVFVMVANNHHSDGHTAIWIPAIRGAQEAMIAEAPGTYFKPPYVGVKGWVGVELPKVSDEVLGELIRRAWRLTAPRALLRANP